MEEVQRKQEAQRTELKVQRKDQAERRKQGAPRMLRDEGFARWKGDEWGPTKGKDDWTRNGDEWKGDKDWDRQWSRDGYWHQGDRYGSGGWYGWRGEWKGRDAKEQAVPRQAPTQQ